MGKNFKKLLSSFLLAGMLHCNAAALDHQTYNKNTSLGNKIVPYEKVISNFSDKNAQLTLKKILNSKLNTLTNKDEMSEDKVQAELSDLIIEMNANTLALASGYNSLESHTVSNSGLTKEQYNDIAANRGAKTTNEQNLQVARSIVQHNIHIILDTLAMVRLQAEEAEIAVLDERDGKNQHFKISSQEKRDVRKECFALFDSLEKIILDYCEYEYAVHGKNGANIAKQIKNNFTKIKDITCKNKIGENDYLLLLDLIDKTANLLPDPMFGTKKQTRAVLFEYASGHAKNRMLSRLQILGYDTNIKPEIMTKQIAKKNNNKVNISVSSNTTNKYTGIGLGLDVTNNLSKDVNLSFGGDLNLNKGINGGLDAAQLLPKIGVDKTFNNNHGAYVGLKGGIQFDKKGISTPFGIYGGYKWDINNKFALDFSANSLANIQRMLLDVGASVGATFKTKNMNIRIFVGFGYTFDLNKNQNPQTPIPEDPGQEPEDPTKPGDEQTPEDPTKPGDEQKPGDNENPGDNEKPGDEQNPGDDNEQGNDNPIYGGDDIETPIQETEDKGDINDLEEKEVDLDEYISKSDSDTENKKLNEIKDFNKDDIKITTEENKVATKDSESKQEPTTETKESIEKLKEKQVELDKLLS